MSPLRFSRGIDEYIEAHTTPVDDYIAELHVETRAMPGAQMLSGVVEGRFLETLAFVTDARLALDVGTFTGNSALSMASGMGPDGKVISLDRDEQAVAVARKFISRGPFADRIDIRQGDALETIDDLDGPFDLVFIDADKTNYRNYWGEQVLDGADESADTVAIRDFNDHVVQDDRVVCVQLTVRDGVTLIRRRA